MAKSKSSIVLTCELVPRTSFCSNVRSLVTDETWDILRRQTYRKANYLCEICGGKGNEWPVECHEIWRYNDNDHVQLLKGLQALCPNCHRVKHMGFATISDKAEEAKQHLMKVNGWTSWEIDLYLTQVWKVWEERNKIIWRLNVDVLRQYGLTVNMVVHPAFVGATDNRGKEILLPEVLCPVKVDVVAGRNRTFSRIKPMSTRPPAPAA